MAISEALLKQKIEYAKLQYEKLLVLPVDNKVAAAEHLKQMDVPMISFNLEVSELLKDVKTKFRPVRADNEVKDILNRYSEYEIIGITDFEVLFSPSLKLEPISYFNSRSRNQVIILVWPDTIDGDALVYAEPGHSEYQKIKIDRNQIIYQ